MPRLSRRSFLHACAAGAATALPAGRAFAVAPADFAVKGIDVSRWQGAIDWPEVKKSAGLTFAFAKATQGRDRTDPRFAANWDAIREIGLVGGAYHYGHPGSDAVAQAEHFIGTVKPAAGDLPPVLDLEADDGKSPAEVRDWAHAFVDRVRQLTGRPAIIYTGFYFWRDKAGNSSDNFDCPLWLPRYGGEPMVPRAWTAWSFWQWTDKGRVPGIHGNVDLDVWHGDRAALEKLRLPARVGTGK
jgi:lysozyme